MSNLVSGLLSNLRNTVILSSIITLVVVGGYLQHAGGLDAIFVQAVLRFLHLVFGIMWIGLLYYFNFVQLRKMPEIPAAAHLGGRCSPGLQPRLSRRRFRPGPDQRQSAAQLHWPGHVARHGHVLQCLGLHLAEPEDFLSIPMLATMGMNQTIFG